MQEYIDKVGYGNRQIGTDRDIDRFWLQGPSDAPARIEITRRSLKDLGLL
jgi:beta-lactamase class D